MTTIRLSRKQQNVGMCYKLLLKSLNYLSKTSQNGESVDFKIKCDSDQKDSSHIVEPLKTMLRSTFTWNSCDKLLRIQREGAKLLRWYVLYFNILLSCG